MRKQIFYCSEFVKYLIEEAEINIELKDIMKPIDFKKIINDDFYHTKNLNTTK